MHTTGKQGHGSSVRSWLSRHLASLIFSLGVISRQPLISFLALGVIGFALALPTGLYLLLHNARLTVTDLRDPPQIALYLQPGLGLEEARTLAADILRRQSGLELGRIISPAQALEEFRSQAGFARSLDSMAGDNPLPAVILLQPQFTQAEKLQTVIAYLQQRPEVEFLQADVQWLRRLDAILALAGHGLWLLAGLLALGVILIVANNARLSFASRKEEIEISSLFGASNAFIRRPFLYHGALYGFFGAVLAIVLLLACRWALATPLEQLNSLFDSDYSLLTITFQITLLVLATGFGLGLIGAWLIVSQHLLTLRPR